MPFARSADPERARRPVEAESRLDAERLHVRERQADETGEHRDGDDEHEIVGEPAERQDVGPRNQRGEAAAQRQRKQHGGLDQRLGDAEPRARDRVVGGLPVRGEADAVGERGRHRVAVRRDVGDVPPGEPDPQRERDRERGDEQRW